MNRIRKILGSFWTLQIAGWFCYWIMISITFVPMLAPGRSVAALFQLKLVRAAVGFGLTSLLRLIYRRLAHSLSINVTAVLVLLCSVMFGSVWIIAMSVYAWMNSPTFLITNAVANFPRDALDYSSTVLAWSSLYFLAKYWQRSRADKEKALQASALANKAQLEMLRYQLNPHFLFNALNSIRALIDEDQERAKRMITQLAEFLRHSLVNEGVKTNPLREEFDALQNYLAIEKIRFEDKLLVEIDVDERAKDLAVPSFILNPLVENAIKHGRRRGAGPLTISISAAVTDRQLIMEVANSGCIRNGGDGTGIGLRNVRERLANLYGDEGTFELNEDADTVISRIVVPLTKPS